MKKARHNKRTIPNILYGDPYPIELEYSRRRLLPSEGYYKCFIPYKLYLHPQ